MEQRQDNGDRGQSSLTITNGFIIMYNFQLLLCYLQTILSAIRACNTIGNLVKNIANNCSGSIVYIISTKH